MWENIILVISSFIAQILRARIEKLHLLIQIFTFLRLTPPISVRIVFGLNVARL